MRIRILESRVGCPPVGTVMDWPESAARSLLANGLAEEVGSRARSRKPKRPRPMRMARDQKLGRRPEGEDNDAQP